MSEYQVGLNVPPFHPNCRGCTAPWFEDDFGIKGQRAARDIKTGETYYVPDDMTYDEWKTQQDGLYGEGSVDKERKKSYNEKADKEQYDRYKKTLGKDVLGNFKDFQELKYSNEEYYSYMKLDFQRQNKLVNHPKLALPSADKVTADDRKFTDYLFNPNNANGWAKGQAFTSRLGYDKNNFSALKSEILKRASKYPANYKTTDEYGDKYEQKIILYGNNGKPANVVVGWKVKNGKAWMTSAYIKEVD